APGNASYNIYSATRLTGELHVSALERALTETVRRQESLRAVFPATGGRPMVVVLPSEPFRLSVTDLRLLPDGEREVEARRLATVEAMRPFDLAHGPLLRCRLVQLGEQEHFLLVTMHHIVSDGWSLGVFARELAATYQAFSLGRRGPLPDLSVQYVDYAG